MVYNFLSFTRFFILNIKDIYKRSTTGQTLSQLWYEHALHIFQCYQMLRNDDIKCKKLRKIIIEHIISKVTNDIVILTHKLNLILIF